MQAAARLLVSAVLGSVPVHPAAPGDQVEPTAAFSNEGLVVAWVARRPSSAEVMYAFADTADLGTFSSPLPISGASGNETIRPHAAAFGSRVAVTWADASKGDHDVYLAISEDGGRSFASPVLAAGGPAGQQDPRAAFLEDGTIIIAFHDSFGSSDEDGAVVWHVRTVRTRDGATFSPALAVTSPENDAYDLFASIAGLGTPASPLAVAWLREHPTSGAPNEIWSAQSIDGGASFLGARRLDTPPHRHGRPRLTSTTLGFITAFDALLPSDGQIVPSLLDPETEYLDVETVTSTDAGRSFGQPTIANTTRALQQRGTDIAGDGDHVAIGWIDHSRPSVRRVVIRESFDAGRTFQEEREASEPMANDDVDHPAIAVKGSTIAVVFEDARGGSVAIRAALFH